MHCLFRWAAALAAIVAVTIASAHTADKGLATIVVDGASVHYQLRLALAAGEAQDAALLQRVREHVGIASNGQACTPATAALTPSLDGGLVAVTLRFDCAEAPRELLIRDELAQALGAPYHTIASVQWPQGSAQFVFTAQTKELRVDLAGAEAPRGFFLLGVEHILIGYDHLLFLLALILGGGTLASQFKTITAFTVAHSITLALAALEVVSLPERWVEAAIALSIACVAAENLLRRRAPSQRWVVSFVFGLVHGFGFSNVLRELGLPAQGLALSLFNFNLGVEAGQMMALLVAVPLLRWLRRFAWEPRATAAASLAALAVGLTLFVERGGFLT